MFGLVGLSCSAAQANSNPNQTYKMKVLRKKLTALSR